MEQKEAFETVIKAIKENIDYVKTEIEFLEGTARRRKQHELQSFENSLEYLQDVMVDLKLV